MSVLLNQPKQTIELPRARVAAIKIEENPYRGQRWIEFYIVLGRVVGSNFEQFAEPETGSEVYEYIKIENGLHPLRAGMALGKCDVCGTWFAKNNGACTEVDCTGTIQPYDGWTRLALAIITKGRSLFVEVQDGSYSFLTTEEVPDPDTWEMRKLLEGIWGV